MNKYKIELEELAKLEENWDSYGALPIDKEVLNTVKHILHLLENSGVFISPLNSGGIQLEWELDNQYFEIEIDPSSKRHGKAIIDRDIDIIHNLGGL